MNVTRTIFAVALAGGFLWVLGFALEAVSDREPSILLTVVLAILVTGVTCFYLFRRFPGFLKKMSESHASAIRYYVIWAILSYLMLVPIFGGLAYLLILWQGDPHHREASIAITLAAVWFPLWWFIPVGLAAGWYRYSKASTRK